MRQLIRPAIVSFMLLTLITGLIYPAIVTGIAEIAFNEQAQGGIIVRDGKAVGSELIAQPFTDPKYFWPRPSACGYDATAGSGSNWSLTNPDRGKAIHDRTEALRAADPNQHDPIPVDLLMASGSGLDPHITPEAAGFQVARIAKARNMPVEAIQDLVDRFTEPRTFGILGEPRVNVLLLNLALDRG